MCEDQQKQIDVSEASYVSCDRLDDLAFAWKRLLLSGVLEEDVEDENFKKLAKEEQEKDEVKRQRHEQRLLAEESDCRGTSMANALSASTVVKTERVALRMGGKSQLGAKSHLPPGSLYRDKSNGMAVGSFPHHLRRRAVVFFFFKKKVDVISDRETLLVLSAHRGDEHCSFGRDNHAHETWNYGTCCTHRIPLSLILVALRERFLERIYGVSGDCGKLEILTAQSH